MQRKKRKKGTKPEAAAPAPAGANTKKGDGEAKIKAEANDAPPEKLMELVASCYRDPPKVLTKILPGFVAVPTGMVEEADTEMISKLFGRHQIWDKLPGGHTIEDRFPGLSGQLLFDLTDLFYVKKASTTVMMFDSATMKCLTDRDAFNIRPEVKNNEISYGKRFLRQGWFRKMRGALEGRYKPGSNIFLWISGGTLCGGFRWAAEKEPDNRYVRKLVREGIEAITELFWETPGDVVIFRKEACNQFHGGANLTLFEVLLACESGAKAWTAYIISVQLHAGDCPTKGPYTFEKIREDYVQRKFKHVFAEHGYDTFKRGLSLKNRLDAGGIFETLREYYSDRADFLAPASNAVEVIIRNSADYVERRLLLADAHSSLAVREFVLEGLMLWTPVIPEWRSYPESLDFMGTKYRKDILDRYDHEYSVGDIACRKKSTAAAASSIGAAEQEMKRRRLSLKQVQKEVVSEAKSADLTTVVAVPDGTRPIQVWDDQMQVVFGPLEGIPKASLKMDIIRAGIRALLTFVAYKCTVFQGEQIFKYSVLRAAVREVVIQEHLEAIAKRQNVAGVPGDEIATLLQIVAEKNPLAVAPTEATVAEAGAATTKADAEKTRVERLLTRMTDLLQEQTWVFSLHGRLGELKGNQHVAVKFRKDYREIRTSMVQTLEFNGKAIAWDTYFGRLAGAVKNVMTPAWQEFGLLFGGLVIEDKGFIESEGINLGLIDTEEQLIMLLTSRVQIISQLVKETGCGEDRILEKDLAPAQRMVAEILAQPRQAMMLGLVDASLVEESYAHGWGAILDFLTMPQDGGSPPRSE